MARGNTYSAKIGENDDLVRATLLCCRLIAYLAKYDPVFEKSLGEEGDPDQDNLTPMPMII